MIHSRSVYVLTLLLGGAETAMAQVPGAQSVTDEALVLGAKSWHPSSLFSGGASNVTMELPDLFGGTGSLAQVLPFPGPPEAFATVQIYSMDTIRNPTQGLRPTGQGFGRIEDISRLAFQWYRDSSSTCQAWLGPAVRLFLFDPNQGVNGSTWVLVWEPVYNGYASGPGVSVPTDTWIASDIGKDFFWRVPLFLDGQYAVRAYCNQFPTDCYRYDRQLTDWGFSKDTVVFGIAISAGPNWSGTYRGFIDAVELDVAGSSPLVWDFEP